MGAIAIACDHAGLPLKQELQAVLEADGHAVLDLGTGAPDPVDYPDCADALTAALADGRAERGVLVCGSGIGMSIAANRRAHVRAVLAHDALGAEMARRHNDANVICFGARMTGADTAKHALKIFLAAEFEGGRHARRVNKLSR